MDFALALELATLDAGDPTVNAQRFLQCLQLAVKSHLARLRRVAQIRGLDLLNIVVERLVGPYLMHFRVFLAQHFAELILFDQALHRFRQMRGVAGEIVGRDGFGHARVLSLESAYWKASLIVFSCDF